jgi:hypothetical protein
MIRTVAGVLDSLKHREMEIIACHFQNYLS